MTPALPSRWEEAIKCAHPTNVNGGYSYPSLIDAEPVEVAVQSGNETVTIANCAEEFTLFGESAVAAETVRQPAITICTEPEPAAALESAFQPAEPSEADQVRPLYETWATPIVSAWAAAQFA